MWKCEECGKEYSKKPYGLCACGAFQSFIESSSTNSIPNRKGNTTKTKNTSIEDLSIKNAVSLSSVKAEDYSKRLKTGFLECDRVLGGGLVQGGIALLSGTPGAGKSTLCLAIAGNVANQGKTVVYVSGEESINQIALRAQRMGITNDNIYLSHETQAESVIKYCEEYKPALCIVDSVQTLTVAGINSSAGSITQSKEVTDMLTLYGKNQGIPMILISQVVKSGDFSGSQANQHIVDTTLKLELDKTSPLRFLRAEKNRFGSTDEVGVFQHVDTGLEEITDPTKIAIDDDSIQGSSGTAISMLSEGARFFPVEIQSLAIPSALGNPRKIFNGVNPGKTHGICAIIDKFCKTRLSDQDVYVNTVSNVKVDSSTCDLAIAASLITSLKGIDMPEGYCYIGELSLTGAIRSTSTSVNAGSEAHRLGYTNIIVPNSSKKEILNKISQNNNDNKVNVIGIKTISDLYRVINSNGTKNHEEMKLKEKMRKNDNLNKYVNTHKNKKSVNDND